MPLFSRRQERAPRAVVASAVKLTRPRSGGADDEERLRRQPWQERAAAYYDQIGPIKYSGQFYARALSKLRIFPALQLPDGEIEPFEDKTTSDLLDRIQDPGGGRSVMFGTYGRLMFITGESLLLGTFDEELGERWEVVSSFELERKDDGTFYRKREPGAKGVVLKPLPPDADKLAAGYCVVYRLWKRHPIWSALADSPMRGVLDDCEELVMLTNAVRRRARSRLTGPGMLLVPQEISPVPLEPGPDEDPAEDPLLVDIEEAMMTPIADEANAAGLVPIILRGAGEHLDKLRLIRFADPSESYQEAKLRAEALQRIAIGLDMPPEVLLGLASSNHWTSHEIDDQIWSAHLQPIAQQLCDDLLSAYLRPAARDANVAEWESLVIGYDNAEIVNRPNRGKDADEAHDRLTISDAAHREAKGFTDADAPEEEELQRRIAIKIRAPEAALGEEPPPEPGEPPPAGPPDESASAPLTASARILGAATMGVERARELAGSRIRTRARSSCPECTELIAPVPHGQVAATLGSATVRDLRFPSDADLVAGASDSLVSMLRRWGYSTETALQIGALVESHAAQTLYEAEPPPLELPLLAQEAA